MAYYTQLELESMGFKSLGVNVRLSKLCSIYGISNVSIGDNSRVDDFTVLSSGPNGICIGCNVHIAVFSSLIGYEKIELMDFSNISSRVSIYSSNDDYSGNYMSNPTIPSEFTNVFSAPVRVGKHAIIASGSILLPGVSIGDGAVVGAQSLVKVNCEGWGVYCGNPLRYLKSRSKKLLDFESLVY